MAQRVAGRIITPSYSFTRPSDTTQYAVADLVANSTTAGSVVPLSWAIPDGCDRQGFVRRVRMWSNDGDTTSASFRVHFFTDAPTVSNGDNGALAAVVDLLHYLGAADVTLDRTVINGDAFGVGVPNSGSEMNFLLTAGTKKTVYALIEARGTYTPASAEVLTVVPEIHLY